jgi:hypothetical protein
MILHQILKIGGETVQIVTIALTLDRDAPGRGIFAVQAAAAPVGDVQLYAGINGLARLYFSGYLEQSVRIDSKQQRLVVRETPGRLTRRAPLARRNSTLAEIIGDLQSVSGVQFRTSGLWIMQSVPHFFNVGSGAEALRLIGQLSGLPDWIALPQADGSVYIGSAANIGRCSTVLRLDPKIFTNLSASGADCAFMPSLRPGMRIRIGDTAEQTITQVTMTGEKLRLGLEFA